ncbi:hypothetical protein RBI14_17290 [Alcaligenaceae bacterium B3P038]|nr:hypothetical protein [Alcaligenaceae bacterium B3P038]
MRNAFLGALLIFSTVLTGCAVENDRTEIKGLGLAYHSNVRQLPNGDFYVENEASIGQGRVSGASANANQDASKYCQAMGKSMRVINEEKSSHLLVNGVDRLTFRCE